MTSEQVRLVKQSFASVVPIADEAAAMFYGRLFEIDPKLRPLFKTELAQQGKKLMAALAMVVQQLEDFSKIAEQVRGLGRAHVRYGVKPNDYQTVGAALLWTLEQGLGKAFTAEVKAAWTAAYGVVSDAMISAASASPKAA
jgi:nitric oxide dioxygenase